MAWDADGNPTWRGCRYVPFSELEPATKVEARKRFNPTLGGRRSIWSDIRNWAFAVRKDGTLSKCPYIEPISGRAER